MATTQAVVIGEDGEVVGSVDTAARAGARVIFAFAVEEFLGGELRAWINGQRGKISRAKKAFAELERTRDQKVFAGLRPRGPIFVQIVGTPEILRGDAC